MLSKIASAAMYANTRVKEMLDRNIQTIGHPILTYSYPGDHCCTVYEAANYGMRALRLCYPLQDPYMSHYGFDNIISSWYCGKNVMIRLCENLENPGCGADYSGSDGAGNIANPYFLPHDVISRVYLYDYDPAIQPRITLFGSGNC